MTCLDDTQAAAFVAGELPPPLRATIEAHVDDCSACRRVLAGLVRADGPTTPVQPISGLEATTPGAPVPAPSHDAALAPWPPGHRVGRYIVLERIGAGGMGAVYRADDPELGRRVALKRLHAGGDRARLVREARAAAQLAHPNVVTVYEVGDDFLAMELVDGTTLTRWLAEARRSWRDVASVLAQAGRGLAAAHAHGLVHRDFKPDNVLVDRLGRARVADFGLARAWDGLRAERARDAGLARMTATGAVSGTPAYLAPELVDGGAPDAASDQYALAIALYEALHGRHPFAGATAQALWAEMAAGNVRPGARPIPRWLDRVVRRGLAVAPAERWPSVSALVDALDRPRRSPWPWIASGGVAAVALAIAGVALTRTPAPPVAAEAVPAPAAQPTPAPEPPRDPKAILKEAALAQMNGDYERSLALADGVLATEPDNEWANQLVTLLSCNLRYDLVQEHGDPAAIAHHEQRARDANTKLSAKTRKLIASACAFRGIQLEGDGATPPPAKKPAPPTVQPAPAKPAPAKSHTDELLDEMDELHDDPAAALAKYEHTLAGDPANAHALFRAVQAACELNYKQKNAGTGDRAASEATARAYWQKLSLTKRWDVWIDCQRWSGIWFEGDIDRGSGKIEHIGPQKPR